MKIKSFVGIILGVLFLAVLTPVSAMGAGATRKLLSFQSGLYMSSSPAVFSAGKDYSPAKWFGYQALIVDVANAGKNPS